MRWRGRRGSENVEDATGRRMSGGMKMGGGIGAIIIALIMLFTQGNPAQLLQVILGGGGGAGPQQQQQQQQPVQDDKKTADLKKFCSVVLADTEDVWKQLFRREGLEYREPTLQFFTGRTQSACGSASSATGPFYCPGDEKIYIDLSFFETLKNQLGADGDFAQAYVIAHEVGHHVQNLLGATKRVDRARGTRMENKMSVMLELQADFYAGVWAHHAQKNWDILERGDIEEAMGAANAIGDDKLQRESTGVVRPDSFTHGTSAQRMKWFRIGFRTGDLREGDTFRAPELQ